MVASKSYLLILAGVTAWIGCWQADWFPGDSRGQECWPPAPAAARQGRESGDSRVAINEIMADPTPVRGLPDAEWIELWNYGDDPVELGGWKLTVGSTGRTLPGGVLGPGAFRIVCSARNADSLQRWGPTLLLSSLPALRNSGNRVTLTDETGSIRDQVDYTENWYGSPEKKNGGWSLERIDPARNCGPAENWSASLHPGGGTPGSVNSIHRANPDLVRPRLTEVRAVAPATAALAFSEPMDTLLLSRPENYMLSGGWGNPVKTELPGECSVRLTWRQPLLINQVYRLRMQNITDACGNPPDSSETTLCRVVLAPGDMVVNELLFNPLAGGADFVELLNVSSKAIGSDRLVLASRDEKGQLKSMVPLAPLKRVLVPGGYLAVTADSTGVLAFYDAPCLSCIAQVPALPAYNNDAGTVVLLSDSLLLLDEFPYREEMHHPLLADCEGVSLERIHPAAPAAEEKSWRSASQLAGFATPGYLNSCFLPDTAGGGGLFPGQTSFSPNQDGYNDALILTFRTTLANPAGNCTVYDPAGNRVGRLLNNTLLPATGTVSWDGRDLHGQLLPPGPYIVVLEIFNPEGRRELYRKAVILTVRLE